MNNPLVVIGIALLTGALISVQGNWSGLAGKQIGAFNTTLLGLVAGGSVAALILIFKHGVRAEMTTAAFTYSVVVGLCGILIGTSISFVVQRLGVTTGLAAVTLGQVLVSFLIDSLGLGSVAVLPDVRRVIGLGLMILAIYLLTPRS